MNEAITKSKENAAKAIMVYRNELLKEFLLLKEELSKKICILCETGIDRERWVCFENVEVEQDICYTVFERSKVIELKESLKKMNEENAMHIFRKFFSMHVIADLCVYDEFADMVEILDADYSAQSALDLLNM